MDEKNESKYMMNIKKPGEIPSDIKLDVITPEIIYKEEE